MGPITQDPTRAFTPPQGVRPWRLRSRAADQSRAVMVTAPRAVIEHGDALALYGTRSGEIARL